jgi:hypothetical protein
MGDSQFGDFFFYFLEVRKSPIVPIKDFREITISADMGTEWDVDV